MNQIGELPMKLTSVFLGDAERQALEQLARASGKSRSECLRAAIREAAKRLAEKEKYFGKGSRRKGV